MAGWKRGYVVKNIVGTLRRYWFFYAVWAALACGLVFWGVAGLLDSTVTCHNWNIFVLDFSEYDMSPDQPSAICNPGTKNGGGLAKTKMGNDVFDGIKLGAGAFMLYIGGSSLNSLARKRAEASPD
ncbi:hypothetical protein [Nocardia sp. NPDC057668]|uniref:hypothetical protein n=1 Tax=Nocardia sp. NPDC057668 TaxID=3346202 RepID=UPI00366B9193